VLTAYPDFATSTAEVRVAEAEETGASVMATACPFFLIISMALSKSPSDSSRAFLQSIIPARVTLLSFATSAVLIVDI